MHDLKLAWDFFKHYLLGRRAGALVRTVAWISMLGVTLGVMALIVVISVMNGFNDSIRKRLLAVEPHLVATVEGSSSAQALRDHAIYQKLLGQDGVQIDVFENQDVILRTVDGLFGGAVARGIEPEALAYMLRETEKTYKKLNTPSGFEVTPLSEESLRLEPGEIMMGIDLARGLGIFEGDSVVVIPPEALLLPTGEAPPFERVVVKRLLLTNIQDVDAKVLFYRRASTFKTFGDSASHSSGYEIRLKNIALVERFKKDLEGMGASVQTWTERNSALFYALRMEKLAIGIFLSLSAMIASFSIVTVLVLLLTQKRKDIGLLMSLGLSPKKTRALFVRVGLILSSVGIFSGLVLGLVVCYVVANYPLPILPDIYYDSTIPAKIEPSFIAGILIFAGLIAYFSAHFPARSVTREEPADTLRGMITSRR